MSDIAHQRGAAIRRTAIVGALWNLALSVLKILVGSIGHSQGLIADGVHSLSDLVSDGLVWWVGKRAAEGPDQEHPYGHGRFESIGTLALGLILVLVALGIAWDALTSLFDDTPHVAPSTITLVAAFASILIKEGLYWYTVHYADLVASQLLRANAWHHRTDAISSVVVLIAIAGAMAGITWLDSFAALIVALMILHIAWELGVAAGRELVDTALAPERLSAVRGAIMSVEGVRDIHMLRTRTHAGMASADVHVLVDPMLSVSEGHMISALVEQRLKQQVDEVTDVTVHIDPEDDEAAPARVDLPQRNAALSELAKLWSDIPQVQDPDRVQLHYINGRIDVDLYLPLKACSCSESAAADLTQVLSDHLSDYPAFGNLRVYFH